MSAPARKPRLLVFVIAYYAESTLRSVLERIPAGVFEEYACEILVVDDASEDRTFAIGQEYRAIHPEIPMTVLRNSYNQGYGGNQKVGYAFAIEGGFDFVAMVHGDAQYAPEELLRLVEPLRDGVADAVFGSRMAEPGAALRGGMPLHKYAGNKILTRLQNFMLRSHLSEFHSGYRVYSVKMLERIRFLLNSDDFDFDTEIIIQLLNAGARIVERPIPTHYGDEISRVNGIRYAKDVLVATLQSVAHRSGVLHQRRFDPHSEGAPHYDLKLGYASSHTYALEAVPTGTRVTQIGGGSAGIARHLADKNCDVTVVAPNAAPMPGVRIVEQDLDDPPKFDVKNQDYVLMLDVIEHLRDPERFLDDLRAELDYRPVKLILTTPNIAFVVQRIMLLLGQFNYGSAGILDRTHRRLLTFRAAKNLLRDAGFKIRTVRGVPAPFPKVFGDGLLGRAATGANLALIALSKTLFAYQIYVEAESTPSVEFVLRDAREKSAANTNMNMNGPRRASERRPPSRRA